MTEPALSMYSLLSLAFQGDEEMLTEAISLMSPDDVRLALYVSLMQHASDFSPEDRQHAARVSAQVAAKYAGESG